MRYDTPDTRRAYTRSIFTVVAPVYPVVSRLLSFGRDRSWKQTLVQALPDLKTAVTLDIACGTGDIAIACKKRFPAAMVIGADNSLPMLSGFSRAEGRSIPLTLQDMQRLAIRTSSIDICTGGYALRNAPDCAAAIAEISRVIKPGGVAAFLDFSHDPRPPFALLHRIALLLWGGLWGLFLHGNPRIYGYIAESLSRFPNRPNLRRLFEAHGFTETGSWRRMFGMVEIVIFARKGRTG
jgi:demethylmenaquinone methyltransferase/2-methoxy-6-polyprenyl-1,4-benzoquinol methylase